MNQNKYILTSSRLGFSVWGTAHISEAEKLWGNIEVTKLIDSRGPLNAQQIKEKLSIEINNYTQFGVQYFPVYSLYDETFIGCAGLRPYKLEPGIFEIGVHLLPEFWQQGYAFEALQKLINYAFQELQCKAIFAGHNPKNYASQKLLSKLQFQYIGDQFFEPTGLNHPSYKLLNKSI